LSAGQALEWVRASAKVHERHVVEAAIELAIFVRDTLVGDAERARFSAFVREVYGERARRLGFSPRRNESDDDQLVRRTIIRFAAPEDPKLAAEARRLAVAWIGDRKRIDPGMVDSVLLIAAETGDAATFDALLAEARATRDSLDRRNLMIALFAFTDPVLARRGHDILLDPAFDIRESLTALRFSHYGAPPRRTTHDFLMAHFDAMAALVPPDTPGSWPSYAARLCSDKDRAQVEAFWQNRIAGYAGGERILKQALEEIRLCAAVRTAQESAVAAFLEKR
jgi:alanyl aminopeptidase